ncbi:protein BatD [Candidatus Marinimicrobia bacterium MT.SAG.2]|nr:protein BatD [Candidatus Marinimicrobia bacterium MT.SAG.2]
MMRYNLYLLTLILFSWTNLTAQKVIRLEATVSKKDMTLYDRFTYKLAIYGETQIDVQELEISNFGDFSIVGGPSQSTNFQFINGEISSSATFSWVLAPKKEGAFIIKPASINYRGKLYKSESIKINVTKTGRSSATAAKGSQRSGKGGVATFLVASADKEEIYKGEQVSVTYRIYTKVKLVNFNTPGIPEAVGFWIEEIPQPNQPLVEVEIVDGVRYTTAIAAKFALFPTRSGELTLDPLMLDYKERVKRKRRNSIFDDFFDDSFFGGFANKRVVSNELKIKVLPLPDRGRPADFSGAVGQFKLSAEIVEPEAKVNDAITLRVKITGVGNIKYVKLPKIDFPDEVEVFEPEISQENFVKRGKISGEKKFGYVLIPRKKGKIDLGRISLSYFDPVSKGYKITRSKPIQIEVGEGDRPTLTSTPGLSREEVAILSSDIRFIKRELPEFRELNKKLYQSGWMVFWGITPLFALSGAFLFRKHLDQMSTNVAYQRRRRASSESKKRLKRAKAAMTAEDFKEFYSEISKALLGAAADRLNFPAASVSAAEVLTRLMENSKNVNLADEFSAVMKNCEMAIYSPEGSTSVNMEETYEKATGLLDNLLKAL